MAAAREIDEAFGAAGHRVEGFLVQRMALPGPEMLSARSTLFGPVVACAAGGTEAELLKDVAVRTRRRQMSMRPRWSARWRPSAAGRLPRRAEGRRPRSRGGAAARRRDGRGVSGDRRDGPQPGHRARTGLLSIISASRCPEPDEPRAAADAARSTNDPTDGDARPYRGRTSADEERGLSRAGKEGHGGTGIRTGLGRLGRSHRRALVFESLRSSSVRLARASSGHRRYRLRRRRAGRQRVHHRRADVRACPRWARARARAARRPCRRHRREVVTRFVTGGTYTQKPMAA